MARTAIVVGAGPAGLACAAMLSEKSIDTVVLERSDAVAPVWRKHYDRLHLHTDKAHSQLPGLKMPRGYPRYPSRDQVVSYMEDYAAHHGVAVEFGREVKEVRRNGAWQVRTGDGRRAADIVVMATGIASYPNVPKWPGQAEFGGDIIHSSAYANPAPYAGKRVLVVGLGNSGGEIALDLAESGVDVALSVRGAVNIIPKEVMGIPILTLSIAQRSLPSAVADAVNRAVQAIYFGDVTQLGLRKPERGPLAQVRSGGRVPLIDIGTVAAIRRGVIRVRPGIASFAPDGVAFTDGTRDGCDAVILATGFRSDLRAILPDHGDLLTAEGTPRASGAKSGRDGLFLCSYLTSPTGQLREIGIEARAIAAAAVG